MWVILSDTALEKGKLVFAAQFYFSIKKHTLFLHIIQDTRHIGQFYIGHSNLKHLNKRVILFIWIFYISVTEDSLHIFLGLRLGYDGNICADLLYLITSAILLFFSDHFSLFPASDFSWLM